MHAAFPLLRLALEQPQLLVQHAAAYSDLLASESADALALLERRLMLYMVAALGLAVALMLAGVALMLMLTLPGSTGTAWLPWVPLPALVGAALAWRAARQVDGQPPFQLLLEQVQIDFPASRSSASASPS